MQQININLLTSLSVLLPNESLKVLLKSSSVMKQNMDKVFNNVLYWKQRLENRLKIHLIDRNIDWEKTYNIINAAIDVNDPFLYVMDNGTVNDIEILLESGFDPTNSNAFLSKRSYPEYKEMIKKLLSDGRVNPNVYEIAKDTGTHLGKPSNYPLMRAIQYNDIETSKLLLNNNNITVDVLNATYYVSLAIHSGEKMFATVIEHPKITSVGILNRTPIYEAVKANNFNILKYLINYNNEIIDAITYDSILSLNTNNIKEAIKILLNGRTIIQCTIASSVCNNNVFKQALFENVENSLSGMSAMHYFYKTNNKDIYVSKSEPRTIFESFYYKFLRNLIIKRLTILEILHGLLEEIDLLHQFRKKEDIKPLMYIINQAVTNILNETFILPIIEENKLKYYFAFLGFLYVCYRPEYSYKDIIDILTKQGADIYAIQMAAKLIGAYFGLDKLIKQGLVLSNTIKGNIKKILNGYMKLLN
jgi:hypothetical protein